MRNTPLPLNRSDLAKFLPDQRAIIAFEELFKLIPADLNLLEIIIEEINNLSSTSLSAANSNLGEIQKIKTIVRGLLKKNLIFVYDKYDLPLAASNVITLEAGITYFFTTFVDLEGDRLVAGQNTALVGSNSDSCGIYSTGLSSSTALITSEWTISIKELKITSGTIFDLDASSNPNQSLNWDNVTFLNSDIVGTIKSYNNVICNNLACIDSSDLTFDGESDTIYFASTLFSGVASSSVLNLPSTLTINRRFIIIYSSFVIPSTSTGITVSTSATIPVEGYILDGCDFSGGGTYISGVQYNDNKSVFINDKGVSNSANISNYYMLSNSTATTISVVNTPVKVAGTTTSNAITQKFTNSTTNRATFVGEIKRSFKCSAEITFSSGANNQIGFYFYKNGTAIPESVTVTTASSGGRGENVGMQCITDLTENDYIELWCENQTGTTDITVEIMNVIIGAIT